MSDAGSPQEPNAGQGPEQMQPQQGPGGYPPPGGPPPQAPPAPPPPPPMPPPGYGPPPGYAPPGYGAPPGYPPAPVRPSPLQGIMRLPWLLVAAGLLIAFAVEVLTAIIMAVRHYA
ncbi:MAG: hypothetical protein J2P57_14630, partial [Acidimicrobiaceae bacterium]|nr:hypothetical protein [Acidimicrobiaceae bacterium]